MTERPEVETQTDINSCTGIEPGMVIDGREVIRCLGTGGMGSVYQTRHTRMDRLEAVKIMHPRFIAVVESSYRLSFTLESLEEFRIRCLAKAELSARLTEEIFRRLS